MQIPLELTLREVPASARLRALVERHAAKLEQVAAGIVSCRVAVERPQRHQRAGSPYRVRIDVTLPPGKEVVVRREPGEGGLHDSLETVLIEAFKAARRQLARIAQERRGERRRPGEPRALVCRRFPEEGYGFLRTLDGREIYFHRNSVLHGDFERLEVGTEVRYVERMGEEGPQASTVQVVNKPGARASRVAEPRVEPPRGWQAGRAARPPARRRKRGPAARPRPAEP
jgi:cold shock CspA family protein